MSKKVAPAPQYPQEIIKLQKEFYDIIRGQQKDGNHQLAEAFLAKNTQHINKLKIFRNQEGKTHLHAAAKYCDPLVPILLEAGYDYAVKDIKGRTAFETAIQYNNIHTIKFFLELGLKNNDSHFMQQFLREKPALLSSLLGLIPFLSEEETTAKLRKQIIVELLELMNTLNPKQRDSLHKTINNCNKAFKYAKPLEEEIDPKKIILPSTILFTKTLNAASSQAAQEDEHESLIPSATFAPLESSIKQLEVNLNIPNVVFASPSTLLEERINELF